MPKASSTSSVAEEPILITRKRAAFLLSCSVQSIDLMRRAGTVDAIHRGRKVLIIRESIQKWMDAEREKERESLRARDRAEKSLQRRSEVSR